MNKYKYFFFSALALFVMALPALAQGGAGGADNESSVAANRALATGLGVIGFGLAAGLAGIGQGLVIKTPPLSILIPTWMSADI